MRKTVCALAACAIACLSLFVGAYAGESEASLLGQVETDAGTVRFGYRTVSVETGAVNTDAWAELRGADGGLVWERTIGGSSMDECRAALAMDGGRVALLLWTVSKDGDMDGNEADGQYNIRHTALVTMVDESGETLWRSFAVPAPGFATSLARCDGGLLLYGERSDGDLAYYPCLIRFDADGGILFDRAYPDSKGFAICVATALSDGDFLLVGRAMEPIPGTNFHTSDGVAARFDGQGERRWEQKFGIREYDGLYGAAEAEDGSLYVCGAAADSIFALSGEGGALGWLLKLDRDGNTLWERTAGMPWGGVFETVTARADGTVAAEGYTFRDGRKIPWQMLFGASGDALPEAPR